jgi:L-rhamnonate dehydratase
MAARSLAAGSTAAVASGLGSQSVGGGSNSAFEASRSAGSPRQPDLPPAPSDLKITDVKVLKLRNDPEEDLWAWLSESLVANPMSIYPKYREKRSSWMSDFGSVYVEIQTDKGVYGHGEGGGGDAAAIIVEKHFKRLLVGEDPFDVERLWDILFRASLPYGRKGLAIMALSGVDLALWDIRGKALGLPVYKLLGGKTKEKIFAYATGNDAEWFVRQGFRAVKLAMPHGPADGREGMRKNVELVRRTREIVGPDADVMLDCYMAWDVEYTLRMAELLEPYKVRWIEEALLPDDYEGFGKLNAQIHSTLIATGEHEFTRFGFEELLHHKGASILQPDITWCGGLTEIRKIADLAAAQGLPVIPHAGGTVWGLHFIAATPNAPWAETIGPSRELERERKSRIRRFFPLPEKGFLWPADDPGFGIDLRKFI